MKILYYLPGAIIGGAETQLLTLCKTLPKDFKLSVVTHHADMTKSFWAELRKHAHIYNAHTSAAVGAVVTRAQPDIIQHFHNNVMSAQLDQIHDRSPVIEVVHGCIHFPNDATRTPKNHTSHVVAVSEDAKTFFTKALPGWDTSKLSVIPNGVDTDLFKPNEKPHPEKKFRIIHSGRMCEGDKKYRKMIAACMSLPKDSWELWLLGDGDDLKTTHAHVQKWGLGKVVKFFGFVKDPENYLPHCDAYISGSESEGFGLSIAEAAACGLPISMWDCGGASRYFINGRDALIARSDAEFSKNLKWLFENPKPRQHMGTDARVLAIEKFSATAMAAQYGELYKKLVVPKITIETKPRRVVGISNTNWSGVTNAVKGWVGENHISAVEVSMPATIGRDIMQLEPEVVILGGDSNYLPIVRHLRSLPNCPKIMMTWHSTFGFNSFAPKDSELLVDWVRATKLGLVDRMGFVRAGMDQAFSGEKFVHFPNRVPQKTERSFSKHHFYEDGQVHLGLFGTIYPWKNITSFLMAASLIKNCVVHVNETNVETGKLANLTGVQVRVHGKLKPEAFRGILGSMDCNIQGGFTESFGLTFCESYRLGVPCLTTPGVKVLPNYRFTEVSDPDDIQAIAVKIGDLVRDRDHIQEVNKHLDVLDLKNKWITETVLEKLCASST